MCDCVDFPQKYGHGFAVLCSIFAVSHILVDSCDYLPIFFCVASLVVWGIQSMAYFRHFHHKYLTKTFQFSLVFRVDWYKLTSKSSEANSGTYANIYQDFILNLGMNHMQYAVFASNQTLYH